MSAAHALCIGCCAAVSTSTISSHRERSPPFDVHAPLLSLPALLETTLTTIPALVPYLWSQDDLVERWRSELSALDGFRVGIAWQGNPEHKKDRFRSVPLRAFAPLAAVNGIRLISLQKGPGTEQLSSPLSGDWNLFDAGSRLKDWADTAGLLKNLDLVVTVDTAVAHLAGALGMPIWLALPFAPDWRWLLNREDSPWYPTMRLFHLAAATSLEAACDESSGHTFGQVREALTQQRETSFHEEAPRKFNSVHQCH